MIKKQLELCENFHKITFDIKCANVTIYPNNCKYLFARHSSGIRLINQQKEILITDSNIVNSKKNSNEKSIELSIPSNTDDMLLVINSLSGNFTIKNLILQKLIIENLNGSINLENIKALETNLQTKYGNINIEIIESALNYIMHLRSKNIYVNSKNKSENNDNNVIKPNERKLDVSSSDGSIKVLFK